MDPLLFVATQLLGNIPAFLDLLASDQSGSVKDQVQDVIKRATGTDNPAEWQRLIDTDAQFKAQLQKDLAETALKELHERNLAKQEAMEIELELTRLESEERDRARQVEFQQYLRDLQDRQEARTMQVRLAEDHNPLAWIPPLLAFALVALIFYLLRGIMIAREPVVNKDVFNVVLGALVTAFTTVVSFYFGSSIGSKKKDEALTSGKMMPNPNYTGDASTLPVSLPPASPDLRTPDSIPGGKAPPAAPANKTPNPTSDGTSTTATAPPTIPAPAGRLGLFRQKAPGVMRDLIRDLGLSEVQAAGILGNIGVECAAFRLLQEQRPLAGRGGWGWCQWTGPRRKAFEKWASERNLDYSGDPANYGYLLHELQGDYASCVRSLKQTHTVEAATTDFMNTFERPAAQYAGLQARIRLGQLALQEYMRSYHV